MNIDKKKLKMGVWYGGKDGEYIPSGDEVEPPENAYTMHTCFPLRLRESVYIVRDHNGEIVDKPMMERLIITNGTHIGGANSDVIVAMVNSGDYTLPEAITIVGSACERCKNVLAYEYLDGDDGYPEYSDEWKRCNTVCDFCREDGYFDRK